MHDSEVRGCFADRNEMAGMRPFIYIRPVMSILVSSLTHYRLPDYSLPVRSP